MSKLPLVLGLLLSVYPGCTNLRLVPPTAARQPHSYTVHGLTRVDDYFWLREKDNPAVIEHLKAENAYTDAVLAPTRPLQQKLYGEFLSRIQEDDAQVPWRKGDWLYYTRNIKGKNYRVYCRKPAAGGEEQVLLDLNEFEKGHEFVALSNFSPSDDGNLLAYALDFTGFREFKPHVKDLRTGQVRQISDLTVSSLAWAADNNTLFYCAEDASKRPYRVYRHALDGTPHLVWEELDRGFNVDVSRTRSGGFIVIAAGSAMTADARFIPADQPTALPRLIAERIDRQEYYVDHRGGEWWIRVNDTGRNFRVVTAPVAAPSRENWKQVVPHRDDVMIENVSCFSNHVVLSDRAAGLPRLVILDPATRQTRPIPMPEAVYTVWLEQNEVFEADLVRLDYESPITPTSTFDANMNTLELTLLKRQPTPNYDPAKYETIQLYATASDGATIPIAMTRRRDLPPGPRPLLLYAYGAYGLPEYDSFDSNRFSLIDRGVTFVTAHIRGGGEMGKIWHEQGRLLQKKNTFTDFIACAEFLIAEGYTTPDQLAIHGISAGGLTVGAVLNMRPDLFTAAIVAVPFVDVINTMLDDSLPLTTQEYLEWGNPNERQAFDYMLSYSPYDNIRATDYPAILVVTSLNDSQVMYHEPAKYVAKLRATKTDSNPLLLHCVMEGGHGGPSGRYDDLREEAMQQAFLLWRWGLTQ